jgi:hypothetical protein
VLALYEGERRKQYFVLSYTHPVYMLKDQKRKVNACMHFYFCRTPPSDADGGGGGGAGSGTRERALFDTRELSADEYLYVRKRYDMCNITTCAGPNDEVAVLWAAGVLGDYV